MGVTVSYTEISQWTWKFHLIFFARRKSTVCCQVHIYMTMYMQAHTGMEACVLTYVTSCVLECCLHPTTPPGTQTHTHTHTLSHRPGCQSYTNSHPLAAGFQDNHGNQSLTPGETSSRSERLHSISTSQYSTHKRTHMHIFHTLTHTH